MSTRENKFQRILQAAVEAIAETGFHKCQVSKIARLADVADGTIYLYFKNKEEILIRIFQDHMRNFITEVRNGLSQCLTTRARLQIIVETHLTYMEQNRSVAIVIQLELRQSNPRIRVAIGKTVQEYYRIIEDVIRQAFECKEITDANVRSARQMIFGALDEAVTDWLLARTPRTLVSQAESMLYLFEGALRVKEK